MRKLIYGICVTILSRVSARWSILRFDSTLSLAIVGRHLELVPNDFLLFRFLSSADQSFATGIDRSVRHTARARTFRPFSWRIRFPLASACFSTRPTASFCTFAASCTHRPGILRMPAGPSVRPVQAGSDLGRVFEGIYCPQSTECLWPRLTLCAVNSRKALLTVDIVFESIANMTGAQRIYFFGKSKRETF